MPYVLVVSGSGHEADAQGLAASLEGQGLEVVLGTAGRESDPRWREARCTVIVWAGEGDTLDALRQAAETASRYNVMVPACVGGFPAERVPERFARVRPGIIPDPASNAPLTLDEPETIARVIEHLWREPAAASSEVEPPLQPAARETGLAWVFLPVVAWLLFCLLFTVGVDMVFKHSNPYAGVHSLNEHAIYATARRRGAQRLEWLTWDGGRVSLKREPPVALAPGKAVTILVHGFNVRGEAMGGYFDEMIAHLREEGAETTFVIYDWPSGVRVGEALGPLAFLWAALNPYIVDTATTEAEVYNIGRSNARGGSADAFADLVTFIHGQTGRRVNVIAHSMGGYLLLEAMRKHGSLADKIGKVALLAPAVPHDALEERVVAAALGKLERVLVFHSRHDTVLTVYGSARHASPMLGAVGPKLATLPSNLVAYNMEAKLMGRDVHGQYLRRDGLIAMELVRLISQ
jgi:pimeloyl-ACP methyl ester carboxylesterase